MDSILAALGLKQGALISGLLGALVSYRFFRELPWPERATTVACGFPTAVYVGPAIAAQFKVEPVTELGIVFLTGAAGISALAAFVKALPSFIEALRGWVSK